jgi:transposase
MSEGFRIMKEPTNNHPVIEAKSGKRSGPIFDSITGRPAGEAQIDPEVSEKPIRRKFTTEYKRKILKEADSCKELGQIGALIRREGLYSSNLTCWRKQREQGVLEGLRPKKRGRKLNPKDPRDQRIRTLEREKGQLQRRLKQAKTIIEFQKKACEILKIPLEEEQIEEEN